MKMQVWNSDLKWKVVVVSVWLSHGCVPYIHNQMYESWILRGGEDEAVLWDGAQAVAQADSHANLEKRGLGT